MIRHFFVTMMNCIFSLIWNDVDCWKFLPVGLDATRPFTTVATVRTSRYLFCSKCFEKFTLDVCRVYCLHCNVNIEIPFICRRPTKVCPTADCYDSCSTYISTFPKSVRQDSDVDTVSHRFFAFWFR